MTWRSPCPPPDQRTNIDGCGQLRWDADPDQEALGQGQSQSTAATNRGSGQQDHRQEAPIRRPEADSSTSASAGGCHFGHENTKSFRCGRPRPSGDLATGRRPDKWPRGGGDARDGVRSGGRNPRLPGTAGNSSGRVPTRARTRPRFRPDGRIPAGVEAQAFDLPDRPSLKRTFVSTARPRNQRGRRSI